MNLILYTICTLIWGSTWLVITFQVDGASPITSVFWRFLLSAVLLLAFCALTKKDLRYGKKDHLLFIGQGVLLFSVNYMLTYLSETMVSSGMTAIAFTTLIYYNMFGMWYFFGKPITKNVILGSVLGGAGLFFLFANEILHFDSSSKTVWGLLLSFIATLSASMGNMISQKNYRKGIPVVITNTYGMLYGSIFTLFTALALQENLAIPMTGKFLGALLYLSLFGSVIAFGAYLTLAGRIGAEKAAYTSVLSPVIALTLSSFFEGFKWTPYIVVGVILCFLGNIITLRKPKAVTKLAD
ncbi:DMT family transporter [Bdellovibrio svalbardensis]|uniref:EamA family transporter n=1 Tax=Bdellovibrio svalbardensis TaxID=2972972 RepID=A0ABT6DK96_9BACT|nr:EamA family transporter [Bdellovibrio svalbardensis]MDG0817285.1 EamA family transporter [Bdellovibrio svalbardensis]